jgi:tetratricopeptide (TPR) repeat protein
MIQGDPREALKLIGKALKVEPRATMAHSLAGTILNMLGRREEALACYDRALALEPDLVMALNDRGNTLRLLGRPQEALTCFERALALHPAAPQFHNNRGTTLVDLRRFEEAVACFDRAIALQPGAPDALNNRGAALLKLDRPEKALADLERAIAIKPDYSEAFNNRGTALQDLKRHREALAAHARALSLRPDNLEARFNLATAHLALGEFDEGWSAYEARWAKADLAPLRRNFRSPLWIDGHPIAGKTMLLHAEQGYGDAIQFVRYAPLVAQRGAKVLLETPRALQALFGSVAGVTQVIARGDRLPPFDLHCPLLSLPHAFRTALDSIPHNVPYLHAGADRLARWRDRLPPLGRPRIGIAWQGRAYPRNRSVPFAALAPLLALPGIEFISLQQELSDEDTHAVAQTGNLRHFGAEIKDFADTAAILADLDAVVSIDSAVAHLAGALGKQLWLMLIFAADFRWLIGREESPWYPTARLIRQSRIGEWSDVVANITDLVSAWHGGGRQGRAK